MRFTPRPDHAPPSLAPILAGPRLTLRGHRAADFEARFALWSDAEVTRYIGTPKTRSEVWAGMRGLVGQWALIGYGYWVIEETATGEVIGEVGFGNFLREIEPDIDDVPEIGWVLRPHAQGKGYATEAVKAALAWGDRHLAPGRRTVCLVDPENAASLRVAAKSGYREYARTRLGGEATIMLERYRG